VERRAVFLCGERRLRGEENLRKFTRVASVIPREGIIEKIFERGGKKTGVFRRYRNLLPYERTEKGGTLAHKKTRVGTKALMTADSKY